MNGYWRLLTPIDAYEGLLTVIDGYWRYLRAQDKVEIGMEIFIEIGIEMAWKYS